MTDITQEQREPTNCLWSNNKLISKQSISSTTYSLYFPSNLQLFCTCYLLSKIMSPWESKIQCFYDFEHKQWFYDQGSQGYPDSSVGTSVAEKTWLVVYVVLIRSKVRLASKGRISGKGTRKCTLAPTAKSATAANIMRPRLRISWVVERWPSFSCWTTCPSCASVFPSWSLGLTDM